MDFLSLQWLTLMMATVSLYWLCPASWRQLLVLVITLALLIYVSPLSAAILTFFALSTYWLTRGEQVTLPRMCLALTVVVVVLAFFKIRFFNAGGSAGDIITNAAIPLGLSYYSFRCFHFIFERYRQTVEQPPLKTFLAYLFFLPTILVGPINRFNDYFREQEKVRWDAGYLSSGLERLLFGYFKVTFLANFLVLGKLGEYITTIPAEQVALIAYLEILQDALLLYLLFAGYSDIAIGFGLLLGIRVMENFNWPYLRKNISEFWQSWHISLSSWCRDYIFFPVLASTRNPYVATLASFTVIGLWHEISLRYICWGLFHGIGLLIWRYFQQFKRKYNLHWSQLPGIGWVFVLLSILLTLHYVIFGLVIVNQPDLHSVWQVYKTILFSWI
jgi:alginate O-acetyltransferase complex protein AlgI